MAERPPQGYHYRTLNLNLNQWVEEHKTFEKHPLELFLVLKAVLLVEEHVLCLALTTPEVSSELPIIFLNNKIMSY